MNVQKMVFLRQFGAVYAMQGWLVEKHVALWCCERDKEHAPHLIGYERVFTEDQKDDLQLAALTAAGGRSNDVWSDKARGLRGGGRPS